MSNEIKRNNKKKLRDADKAEIINSLEKMRKVFQSGNWLNKNNRYLTNTIERIKNDTPGRNNLNSKHIADYISVSSIIHCIDGWKYLGKSVDSVLKLDTSTAMHLAYYAELRGGLSILSSQGVGVFSKKHIVLKGSRKTEYISRDLPTHDMTWKSLEHWSGLKNSAKLLLSIIKPDHNTINDWLLAFGIDAYRESVGKEWLKSWGVDLKRFSSDRNARNHLSYRPTFFNKQVNVDYKILTVLLDDIWSSSLYPTFNLVDLQLLRLSLRKGFELKTGKDPVINMTEFKQEINHLLNQLGPSGHSTAQWLDYLTKTTVSNSLITHAFGNAKINDPDFYAQMISRAYLLLRLATGFVQSNLSAASIDNSDLLLLIQNFGESLGYWNQSFDEDELYDNLFSGVEDAITELVDWSKVKNYSISNYDWNNSLPKNKIQICQTERIGLSGILS